MNLSDIPRIITAGHAAATAVDRLGAKLFKDTRDWQSPLRSGASKGPKNQHSDPTGTAAANPDALALEHEGLVDDLMAYYVAASKLTDRLHRLAPIDPNKVERGRVNTVAVCLACAGPAPRCRRGFCDACYTAWIRKGRPDMVRFCRERRAELQPLEPLHIDPTVFPLGTSA